MVIGSIEVLQEGQMQGVQSTKRFSPRTKTKLTGSKIASSPKAPKANGVVDKANFPPYGSKLSNSGPHQSSYTECNVPRKKRAMSEGIESDTELKSMPTPIDLYEDECVFCHSFRATLIHGPMVRYLAGRIVSSDETNPSNGIYAHMKCMEWAPRVWFEGDTIRNLESEIHRASRLRCHRCGLWGAALGCYYERCNKSFHVPCAVLIYGCRWDVDNKCVLCPEHVSEELPCDKLNSQTKERHKVSSLPQSQYSEKVDDYQGENEETTDQLNASNSSLRPPSQSSHKEAVPSHSSREGQQIDQPTASSSSSLRLSCCPDEEGISNACQGEEMKIDRQEISSYPSDKWVLLGSSLSASEKDSFEDFACWTKATVTNEWSENVTHVIIGKNAGRAWSRSYEVLMAILFGKWVVRAEWIVDCLELRPNVEDSYEVTFSDDSHRSLDGPNKGRIRAAEGAPKLFSGLHFCPSACMNPGDRGRMRTLIAAAGGRVVERSDSLHWRWVRGDSSQRPYFVYDGGALVGLSAGSLRMEVEEAREHVAAGARVISHLTVLDAVAAYDAEVLDEKRKVNAVSSVTLGEKVWQLQ